jgi:hypothetical protein
MRSYVYVANLTAKFPLYRTWLDALRSSGSKLAAQSMMQIEMNHHDGGFNHGH